MSIRTLFCLTVILLFSVPALAYQQARGPGLSLTLWLMPAQPAVENTPVSGSEVEEQIAEFNLEFGANSPVTVINTTDSYLRTQLRVWNQEYAGPSWPIVKGQAETLRVIAKFARDNQIHINVRFLNWGSAFKELEGAAMKKRGGNGGTMGPPPDIAQVGSTWVAYFASKDLVIPHPLSPEGEGLSFRGVSNMDRASILYTVDVRLLFYWKRNRLASPTATQFELKSNSWEAIVESLKSRVLENGPYQNPPMVIPTGLTLNLLHDYAPLVWAGGGEFLHENALRTYVDLTSEASLQIPEYLASNTSVTDDKELKHPVITFPEMSTEEATKHFLDGDFIAIQKPAGFITRWYEKFEKDVSADASSERKQKGPVVFWDYVGVAVPPRPFKGGSDLIVLNGTQDADRAFALARFLVSDEDYTGIIARFEGYLPAQVPGVGVNHLIESLQASPYTSREVVPYTDPEALKQSYSEFVNQVVLNGKEYPELATFPIDVESRESLEAFQILLRRVGEGDKDGLAGDSVAEAAEKAESVINLRIDWLAKVKAIWPYIVAGLLGIAILAFLYAKREARRNKDQLEAEKQRVIALDQVRKVRGFASSALLSTVEAHGQLKDLLGNGQTKKSLIVLAGLQGWRRGREESNFEDSDLEDVVWRAVILALESTYKAQLFRKWEDSKQQSAQEFLKQEGLLRDEPGLSEMAPRFYFDVRSCRGVTVAMPFMLEQALVCFLQNAIKASRDELGYHPISITSDGASVSVINVGKPLDKPLCDVLNNSKSFDEFERGIIELLKSKERTKPGIGLVEAYCVTTQCYAGLEVDRTRPKVTVRLKAK